MKDPLEQSAVAQRLIDLEIKASFTEDLLDQLELVIVRQQKQIDALVRDVASLRLLQPAQETGAAERQPGDDLPPHF